MPKTAYPVINPKTENGVPARLAGVLFAAVLQAGFVYALVAGLDIKLGTVFQGPIEITMPKKIVDAAPPPAAPDRQPDKVLAVTPAVEVETPRGDTALVVLDSKPGPAAPGPADRGPVGVAPTHTIPPYPALEARLGAEGTVTLRLVIGADGRVKAAQIVQTSGAEGLDWAAVAWVMAHWRYQPALKDGKPVDSAANVAVTFQLKR
jgi:TonB family C-terminal domain